MRDRSTLGRRRSWLCAAFLLTVRLTAGAESAPTQGTPPLGPVTPSAQPAPPRSGENQPPSTGAPAAVSGEATQTPPGAGGPAPSTVAARPAGPAESAPAPLTLAQLEQMALQSNPTLAQAGAAVDVARGRQRQAGAYPNPSLHYHAEEIGQGGAAGQHGPRFEQTIVTGGKLGLARRIREQEVTQAEVRRQQQKFQVLVGVREAYYEALAAQERVDVRTGLLAVATDTHETTRELHNVGLSRESELLQAQVDADRARLELSQAVAQRARVWRQLAAAVGDPDLASPRPLAGSLADLPPKLDLGAELQRLLAESPEIQYAKAGVTRAEYLRRRERAQRTPDVNVVVGPSYDFNSKQMIGEVDLSVPLPIFNRNRGNIQAAEGEIRRAQADVRRVEMSLRSRMGDAFETYQTNQRLVEEYRDLVLPGAKRAYELTLEAYRRGAESFDRVLQTQRTLFQTQSEYTEALEGVQRAVVHIRGFLLQESFDPVMPLPILPAPWMMKRMIVSRPTGGLAAARQRACIVDPVSRACSLLDRGSRNVRPRLGTRYLSKGASVASMEGTPNCEQGANVEVGDGRRRSISK
jgi:outer membrane protein, heavy metal efflux system